MYFVEETDSLCLMCKKAAQHEVHLSQAKCCCQSLSKAYNMLASIQLLQAADLAQ